VRKLHQDAQRLLRPLLVVNPYARALTFRDDRTRTRRDHLKYLTLIRTLALLHQHQRPLKRIVHHGERVEYVEVTLEDIAVANRLAHEVLGRRAADDHAAVHAGVDPAAQGRAHRDAPGRDPGAPGRAAGRRRGHRAARGTSGVPRSG
jgi:hypothetical protein